jgi:predicted small metal-binding protein
MRLVSGNEEEAIHGIPELSQEKIDKIKEIIERLKVLKGLVSSNTFSTKGESLEEAAKKIHTMRLKLGKSYKVSLEEIMNTDFKELMDF